MSFRATKSSDNRQVLDFRESRLTKMDGGCAYLELSPGDQTSPGCALCGKNTRHEHSFTGRMKFDPKDGKHFVSFAGMDVKDKPKAKNSLEVIPLASKRKEKPVERSKGNAGQKTLKASRIFPLVTYNESDACKTLLAITAEWASKFVQMEKTTAPKQKIVAIKITCLEELILARLEGIAGESQDIRHCQLCMTVSEDSPESLASHLKMHGIGVKLRRLPDVKSKIEDDGALQTSDDVLAMEYDAEQDRVVCRLCGEQFDDDEAFIGHSNEVHARKGEAKHQCTVCLQVFKSRNIFLKHQKSSHLSEARPRRHGCHFCDKRFLKPQHLQKHVETHLGSRQHKCQDCERSFASQSSLKSHRAKEHGDGENSHCDDCGKDFYSRAVLNRHVMEKHTKDPRRQCPRCQQYFLRRDNLQEHMSSCKARGSQVEMACVTCDKKFKSKESLEQHRRSYHGVLPWNKDVLESDSTEKVRKLNCKVCEHDFLPEEMEAHLRFSHGVMPVRGPEEEVAPTGNVSEVAEAILRTLTPQPDYLLRCLTPLPLDTLDDFMIT